MPARLDALATAGGGSVRRVGALEAAAGTLLGRLAALETDSAGKAAEGGARQRLKALEDTYYGAARADQSKSGGTILARLVALEQVMGN